MEGAVSTVTIDRPSRHNALNSLVLREQGKPVVTPINADALGGGFGLMLACDLVVAREDARLGCPEINAGCSR